MGDKPEEEKKEKKNPAPAKVTKIFPTSKCKLRLLKLERVKDFLLMEQEFIQNQEIHRPREEQNEVNNL
jgi:26S proteasome regulatory subunit T2